MKSEIQQLIEKMSVTNDAKEVEKIRQEINRKVLATDKFKIVRFYLEWSRTVSSFAYGRQGGYLIPNDDLDIFNLLELIDD